MPRKEKKPRKKQETKVYSEVREIVRRNQIGLRIRRGLSQRKLAAAVGVTQATIWKTELPGYRIPLSYICNIFTALDSPVHLAFVPGAYYDVNTPAPIGARVPRY